MNKVLGVILSCLYLFFCSGATVHQHYCMGDLVGTSLFDFRDDACGKCGMEKHTEESKNCCKDVSITVKSDDTYTYSQPDFNMPPQLAAIFPMQLSPINIAFLPGQPEKILGLHSPPLLTQCLFIRFGNFRV